VKSFTPLLTTFLVLTQALGILFWTSTYMFNPLSNIYITLSLCNRIFVGLSYCLFILMCLVALARNGLVSYVKSVVNGRTSRTEEQQQQQQTANDAFEHFNGEVVPALHMGACFFVSVIQLAWSLLPVNIPAATNTAFNICVIFANAFVLVIEMRIRQSEVTHGLDQLQSKRAFVRFISHEVRTPLSTASMGLELMATAKFLASVATESTKNAPIAPADRDEFNEELGLVQESLHVAEGIFNDLVEYDGLGSESAPLTLVYTPTRLPALVRQALGPLTLQARRGGVVLRDLLCEAGADAAVVEVDQRRIAQAVRTVLAGAIGAAPKGSEVTATLRLTSSAAASEALAAAPSSSKSSTKSRPQAAAATPPVAVRSGNRRASLAAAGNNQNPMFAPAGTVPAPTKLSCFRRAKVFIGLPDTEPVASASGGGGGIAGMVLLEVA
jgi:signal transduction histidine kinase